MSKAAIFHEDAAAGGGLALGVGVSREGTDPTHCGISAERSSPRQYPARFGKRFSAIELLLHDGAQGRPCHQSPVHRWSLGRADARTPNGKSDVWSVRRGA